MNDSSYKMSNKDYRQVFGYGGLLSILKDMSSEELKSYAKDSLKVNLEEKYGRNLTEPRMVNLIISETVNKRRM